MQQITNIQDLKAIVNQNGEMVITINNNNGTYFFKISLLSIIEIYLIKLLY